MDVGQVDDAVANPGAGTQTVEVVEVAPLHGGARRAQGSSRGIGPSQAEHLVAVAQQPVGQGRAHESAATGDQHFHAVMVLSLSSPLK